ncbi:MAG: MarR family transcriptional regulator [Proteobacteria bacterium]|nr:MarR family transcriptional regulator [Pseudomonadota bacterium]
MSTETRSGAEFGNIFHIEDHAGHMLRRAHQRATANLHRHIAKLDLTAQQFATLARLAEYGAVSQNQLGRLVDMEPANIHGLVRRLLKRGLVRTESNDADRRQLLVSLTSQGRALLETGLRPSEEANEETLASLSAAERTELFRILGKIAVA